MSRWEPSTEGGSTHRRNLHLGKSPSESWDFSKELVSFNRDTYSGQTSHTLSSMVSLDWISTDYNQIVDV